MHARCYSCGVKWVPERRLSTKPSTRAGPRASTNRPWSRFWNRSPGRDRAARALQKLSLMDRASTFTVYGEKEGTERIFPFDFVRVVIPSREWERLQRAGPAVTALTSSSSTFIRAKVPQGRRHSSGDRSFAQGVQARALNVIPPRQIFTHVVGTDIIRNGGGEYLVLETTAVPLGVSYVLENRNTLNRVFPEFFKYYRQADQGTTPPCCSTPCCMPPRSARSRRGGSSRPAWRTRVLSHSSWPARWALVWSRGPRLNRRGQLVFMRTTQGASKGRT